MNRPMTMPSSRDLLPEQSQVLASENLCEQEVPIVKEEASRYRAMVARPNYVAQDRSDIHFAVK